MEDGSATGHLIRNEDLVNPQHHITLATTDDHMGKKNVNTRSENESERVPLLSLRDKSNEETFFDKASKPDSTREHFPTSTDNVSRIAGSWGTPQNDNYLSTQYVPVPRNPQTNKYLSFEEINSEVNDITDQGTKFAVSEDETSGIVHLTSNKEHASNSDRLDADTLKSKRKQDKAGNRCCNRISKCCQRVSKCCHRVSKCCHALAGHIRDQTMTENSGFSNDPSEDGVVVLSIPVPVLNRTISAPELSGISNGTTVGGKNHSEHATDAEKCKTGTEDNTKEGKNRLLQVVKLYRLHIFVFIIFFITVLSVSLSWHFRNMAQNELYASQAIFFNPRTRKLTLADPTSKTSFKGSLGLDIPPWMLPLHCPIVSNGDPHYKECLWKNYAILRIVHFQGKDVQCYNISWQSLDQMHAPHDCYYLNDDKWYGPSNQSESTFPISGQFNFQPKKNYTLSNNGIFNSVVDFYWLSSRGAAIFVQPDSPIQMSWNETGNNQLCIRSNFSGPLYHKTNAYDYPDMNYTLCNGIDSYKTHIFMQTLKMPTSGLKYPPEDLFRRTHWSLKSFANTENITQDHVLDLLSNATNNSFYDNQITLDGNWQPAHGDLNFDTDQFTNVTQMFEMLQSENCFLTLSVSPYFQYMSQHFHSGILSSVFVNDAGGEVTGLTSFNGGLAAILDVFAVGGIEWYINKLQKLAAHSTAIASYRLTYGDQAWLPYKPHFSNIDATPNMYRKLVTESIASLNLPFIVEHTSDSRNVASFIPVVSEIRLVQDKACICDVIETALTLGLMGYPFVMADGVTVKLETEQNKTQGEVKPSKELYIRWLQLAMMFPVFQFSYVPWEYDLEVVNVTQNLSARRNQIVIAEILNIDLQNEVALGWPILRPLWWMDAHNRSVHDMKITDEFLIGKNLLVAPVLCEGVQNRDIYIPPGIWEDYSLGTFVLGPNILYNYSVELYTIPMFRRKNVYGENKLRSEF